MKMTKEIIRLQGKSISYLLFSTISLTIILIGMNMNFIVLLNNDGKMPVYTRFIYSTDTHFSYQDPSEVNYPLLTDFIKNPFGISSLGDFLMIGGALGWITLYSLVILNLFKINKLNKKW